jgi:hypothetical protein
MTQTKIDWTKPIELDDGTPVELVGGPDSDGDCQVRTPKYSRVRPEQGSNWWWYNSAGMWIGGNPDEYYTIRNRVSVPIGTRLVTSYGFEYRIDRGGYVLLNGASGWTRLGQTRTRLLLGIFTLIGEVEKMEEAGLIEPSVASLARITTRNLLANLTAQLEAVQRDTMADLFETLQTLLASLGDPEGKTEWARRAA